MTSLLMLEGLLGHGVLVGENQRFSMLMGPSGASGEVGGGRGVEDPHTPIARSPAVHWNHSRRLPLRVGYKQFEVIVLEEQDVDDWGGIVVNAAPYGKHTRVSSRLQRDGCVADGVRPACHAVGVCDLGLQEVPDVELAHRIGEGRIQAESVLPEKIHSSGVGTELGAPFDPGHVSDQEPPVLVFKPEAATVVVLVWRRPIDKSVYGPHLLVHDLPRTDVIGGVLPGGVIRDNNVPWMVLGLGVDPGRAGCSSIGGFRHRDALPSLCQSTVASDFATPASTNRHQSVYSCS